MNKEHKQSRYPGIRSFERGESHLFFGREREAEELFSMIKVKPLTVLFAKSGIGKTSLINAGVIPLLENDFFYPVKVRLQDLSLSPVEAVTQTLKPYLNDSLLGESVSKNPDLWEIIKACSFKKDGNSYSPVFIFDQFEEFFNHTIEDQITLIEVLADLINERLPSKQQEAFRAIPRKERTEAQLDWYTPAKVRVVFSIRSDRMSMLDDLKIAIPTVLYDRFHLQSLSQNNAKIAITEPAQIKDENFATPPFSYSQGALSQMLAGLSNENGEVESFQLQLLCQYIEEKIKSSEISEMVETQHFGGQEGIREILNDYYERSIDQLSLADQEIARRFIEEGLIVNGKRVGVAQGVEASSFGLSSELLDQLLESRLIRSETIHLGKIYELSHDTLVAPILESYEKRRLEEERRQAEQRIQEEKAKVEAANKKRRMARLYAIIGFSLFFIALIAGVLAYLKSEESKRNETRAKASALAAKAWLIYQEDQTLALRWAEGAQRIDPDNQDIQATLNKIVNIPTSSFYKAFLPDHEFEVECAAFSPDSKYLLTGSFDTDIFLWDLEGNLVREFLGKMSGTNYEGHGRTVTNVDFSPDGNTFISSSLDRTIKIWNTAGGLIKTLEGHRSFVFDAKYSTDGQRILSASRDETVKIWDAQGNDLKTIPVGPSGVIGIDVLPGQRQFVCALINGVVQVRNFDGNLLRQFKTTSGHVKSLDISPDGQLIALGVDNNTAEIWNLEGQKQMVLRGHMATVEEVEFSQDGQWILTSSYDKTARLWNQKGDLLMILTGHREKVSAGAISPDGNYIATGGFDFTAKIWDTKINFKNRIGQIHTNSIYAVDISPDNQLILTGSRDGTAKIWNWEGDLLTSLQGHTDEILTARFSPNGQTIATCSFDGTAKLWDLEGNIIQNFIGHKGRLNYLDFSPDGQLIATSGGARDGTIKLWNLQGQIIADWFVEIRGVASVNFSPNGQELVTADFLGWTKIWDLEGNLIDSLNNERTPVKYALFHPNTEKILTTGQEMPIKTWNRKGEIEEYFFGHVNESYRINFFPDRKRFVTSSWDKSAIIWDENGSILQRLPHPDGVFESVVSKDGKYVITGCKDNIVRIWNLQGEIIQKLGNYLKPEPVLNNPAIASLNDIPISIQESEVALEFASIFFAGNKENFVKLGKQYERLGTDNQANYEEGLNFFKEALEAYGKVENDSEIRGSTNLDSIIANCYYSLSYHYLIHKKFKLAEENITVGLEYDNQNQLKVLQVISWLFNSKFDQAHEKYQALKKEDPNNPNWHEDFATAIYEELQYFKIQYGIQHPDLDRFLEMMKAEQTVEEGED